MMKTLCSLLLGLTATPFCAAADVVISEIMYDPKEGDANAGGEWIEVYNTGSSSVDLTQWIFFENETNHGITADGTVDVPAGGYAVISRDLTAFKNYFSGFSGLLFKASFSLNDGETLGMKENKEVPVSGLVTYVSETGGKDDGNSLQKSGSSWVAASPTPGAVNASVPSASPSEASSSFPLSGSSSASTNNQSSSGSAFFEEEKITAGLEAPKNAIVGVDVFFKGKAFGFKNEPIANARFIWAFGDGSMKEGESVIHTYAIPGDYVIVLEISSGKYSASARSVITVAPSRISIRSFKEGIDGFIELFNDSSVEVDLSFWQLSVGSKAFAIPKNTHVLAGKSVLFPNSVTGLSPAENAALYYPNGSQAVEYEKSPVVPLVPSSRAATPSIRESDAPKVLQQKDHPAPEDDVFKLNASSSLAAALVSQNPSNGGSSWKWILMLGGVMVVASAAYWVAGREKPQESEGFEIIDITEKDSL